MSQHAYRLLFVLFIVSAPNRGMADDLEKSSLIPWPRSIEAVGTSLELTSESRIAVGEPILLPLAKILAEEIHLVTGLSLNAVASPGDAGDIILSLTRPSGGKTDDFHELRVTDRVEITGASYRAIALGTVTLLQSLRVEEEQVSVPGLIIRDEPHFSYNGTMLDVARKPFSIATLERCVEVCRFYKIRFLQLHLTDENAWTFPSEKFPQLGSQNFAWAGGAAPTVYDRDELKGLVDFAAARGVVIVPEIEVPGHSGQLRGTLPEIFGYIDADGKPAPVGVINMVDDAAYSALDLLMKEVADVFHTSPFIHIGCDEASLGGIENLPAVTAFAKKHNLASPHDVFNEFVLRMHKIVAKHGKRMIVWEGAPLGPKPLPRDILVMPWVGGSTLADHLVEQGYNVINAPWGVEQPYFDPYRVNGSRLARGEPRLFGATSILWESESSAAVPYLRFTGALRNEPSYSPDSGLDYEDFLARIAVTDQRLDRLLHGFTLDAVGVISPEKFRVLNPLFDREIRLSSRTSFQLNQIHYTLDGNEPTIDSPTFDVPIALDQTTTVKAKLILADGQSPYDTLVREYRRVPAIEHDAVGAVVTVDRDIAGYPGPGTRGLADGYLAAGYDLHHPGWVGWVNDGRPLVITLDLGKPKTIRRIGTHCLRSYGGVNIPNNIEIHQSDDNAFFRKVADVTVETGMKTRGWFIAEFEPITTRFLRLDIHPGGDWTFIDEITLNAPSPEPTARHAGFAKPVTVTLPPFAYTAPGIEGLTDGYVSDEPNFLSLEWLGFDRVPLEATIDLGDIVEIGTVSANFLQDIRAGIFIPPSLAIYSSTDGERFEKVGETTHGGNQQPRYVKTLSVNLTSVKARYVKIAAPSNGQWLFVDEVIIER